MEYCNTPSSVQIDDGVKEATVSAVDRQLETESVSGTRVSHKRQLDDEEYEDFVVRPRCAPLDYRNHLFDVCRQRALDFLTSSQDVFVLDAYMANECVLHVRLATEEVSLSIKGKPWSIVSGMPVSVKDLKTRVAKHRHEAIQSIMDESSKDFSPSRIVRFILDNCNGVPAIVSHNYTNLMVRFDGGKCFMDYIAYLNLLPGSQRCCKRDCDQVGSTVHIGANKLPKGIYCAKHVRELGLDDQVLLYNPLLISFTAHVNKFVLSAMDIGEVYGPRWGYYEPLSPMPLPKKWTPLCKKYHPRDLKSKRPSERYIETATNILDCGVEHSRRNNHAIGVDWRHSITCCLLKAFLKKTGNNRLCEFYYGQKPSREDLPHSWPRFDI